jgi:hypothetical protein
VVLDGLVADGTARTAQPEGETHVRDLECFEAFTYFTPREKHYMLTTLFESLGLKELRPLAALTVNEATAAKALAIEERVFETIAKYGLE